MVASGSSKQAMHSWQARTRAELGDFEEEEEEEEEDVAAPLPPVGAASSAASSSLGQKLTLRQRHVRHKR